MAPRVPHGAPGRYNRSKHLRFFLFFGPSGLPSLIAVIVLSGISETQNEILRPSKASNPSDKQTVCVSASLLRCSENSRHVFVYLRGFLPAVLHFHRLCFQSWVDRLSATENLFGGLNKVTSTVIYCQKFTIANTIIFDVTLAR